VEDEVEGAGMLETSTCQGLTRFGFCGILGPSQLTYDKKIKNC